MSSKVWVLAAWTAVCLGAGLGGCNPDQPKVRSPHWNLDSCAHCRMAVSSPPFAAQLVGPGGQVRFYDDLGCLILDQREHPRLSKLVPYVVAPGGTDRWIPAAEARFAEGLATPMNFGFAPRAGGPLTYVEVVAEVALARPRSGGKR